MIFVARMEIKMMIVIVVIRSYRNRVTGELSLMILILVWFFQPPDIHAETISAHNPKVVPELVLERVLMGQRVVAVACGHLHSVVITQGGRLWSWGCGEHGRLGHGDEKDQVGPRLCEALLEYNVRSIGCGGAHTIAVTTPSRVHAWVGICIM